MPKNKKNSELDTKIESLINILQQTKLDDINKIILIEFEINRVLWTKSVQEHQELLVLIENLEKSIKDLGKRLDSSEEKSIFERFFGKK